MTLLRDLTKRLLKRQDVRDEYEILSQSSADLPTKESMKKADKRQRKLADTK